MAPAALGLIDVALAVGDAPRKGGARRGTRWEAIKDRGLASMTRQLEQAAKLSPAEGRRQLREGHRAALHLACLPA